MTRRQSIALLLPGILLTACAAPRATTVEQPTRGRRASGPCAVTAPVTSPRSCERACADGDIGSCILVGKHLTQSGESERAAAFLDLACYEGSGASCALLADAWALGRGLPRDFVRAAFYHRRACDHGAQRDCAGAELFTGREHELRLDVAEVAALYARACHQGFAGACFNLGVMVDSGGFDLIGAATPLYRRACDQGDRYSCETFADRIATVEAPALPIPPCRDVAPPRMPVRARPDAAASTGATLLTAQSCVPRQAASPNEAYARAHIFDTACRLGHDAGCYGLARMYSAGGALPQDGAQMEAFYDQACTLGDVRSCLELQRILETPQPFAPALPIKLAAAHAGASAEAAGSLR